jgi:hypothetical protein
MSYPSINKLVVSGSSLSEFKHWLGGQPLDLKRITPIPEKLKETEERDGWRVLRHPDKFRKWVLKNWGTRGIGWAGDRIYQNGSSDSFVMTEEAGKIIMIFETNLSPPIAALNTLSKKFPDLTFDLRFFCYELDNAEIAKIKNGYTHDVYLKKKDPRFREIVDELSVLSVKASRSLIGRSAVKNKLDLEKMCNAKGDGDGKKTEVKSKE